MVVLKESPGSVRVLFTKVQLKDTFIYSPSTLESLSILRLLIVCVCVCVSDCLCSCISTCVCVCVCVCTCAEVSEFFFRIWTGDTVTLARQVYAVGTSLQQP